MVRTFKTIGGKKVMLSRDKSTALVSARTQILYEISRRDGLAKNKIKVADMVIEKIGKHFEDNELFLNGVEVKGNKVRVLATPKDFRDILNSNNNLRRFTPEEQNSVGVKIIK